MSGLIWIQTVCKGYQQTTLIDKKLNNKQTLQNNIKMFFFSENADPNETSLYLIRLNHGPANEILVLIAFLR